MGRVMRGGSQAQAETAITLPYWGEIFCTIPCNANKKYVKHAEDFTVDDLKNAKYLWEASEGDFSGERITIPLRGNNKTYSIIPEYIYSDLYVMNRAGYTKQNLPTIHYMVERIKSRHAIAGADTYLIINAENETEAKKLLTEALQ